MTEIRNEHLAVTINQKGAELSSLKSLKTNTEYIWQADPTHWGRHAPVLFPIVGKLNENQYEYRGQHYPMGQHGFARDMDFELQSFGDSSATFMLRSNDDTRAKYPFDWELTIRYVLEDTRLSTHYKVKNTSTETLYFSIGGHPAFNCPLTNGAKRSNYKLVFSDIERTDIHYLTDGVFAGEMNLFQGDRIQIADNLFEKDALVFKKLNSKSVELQDDQEAWLKFDFEGFPYLGIWSKSTESPFVCIEPWFGIADTAHHSGKLEEKEGILKLAAKEEFKCCYSVSIL